MLGILTHAGRFDAPRGLARAAVRSCWAPRCWSALVLVPFLGAEVNGAKRWLHVGLSFQPSEFLKPAFAITLAWILSWRVRDPNLPVIQIATGLLGV